jgi:hypothetical protein
LLGLGLYEAFVKTLIVANEILALAFSESLGTSRSPRASVIVQHEEILLSPEDIISTGTPGAVEIRSGDAVFCRTEGFEPLSNPVLRRR